MWARVASVVVGIWLMAAPTALEYGGPARTADHILGPLAAGAAIVAMSEVVRGVRWLEAIVGAALVIAPWLLGYALVLALHSVAAGALLVRLGASGSRTSARFGGGWVALLRPPGDVADAPG